jgi:hypothetical protein
MNRRHFLMGLAAAAALPHRAFAAFAPEQFMQIPLWNGTPPGGGGPYRAAHCIAFWRNTTHFGTGS